MKKLLLLVLIGLFCGVSIASALTITGTNTVPFLIQGRQLSQLDFSLTQTVNPVVISGPVTSTSSFKDMLFQSNTSAVVRNNATINFSQLTGGVVNPIYVSQDTGIATVDNNGNVTWVSNGTARINATVDWLTRRISVPVSQGSSPTITTLTGYATSSLAKSDSDAIDTMITNAGATTTSLRVYSTENDTSGIYVRNTSNFLTAAGVDQTCVAVWNSNGGKQQGGTLITPRHIALAAHFEYGASTTVRFVDNSNNTVTATVLTGGNVPGTDIWVDVLTADVPSSITPCKILPANYATYLPSIAQTATIPGIGFLGGGNTTSPVDSHPFKLTTVRDLFIATSTGGLFFEPAGGQFSFIFPNLLSTTTRDKFYFDNVISGDSGNPAFLVVNNALSYVTSWFLGGGGFGPSYPDNITGINSLITSLGNSGGYQVSTTSLAGFNTY